MFSLKLLLSLLFARNLDGVLAGFKATQLKLDKIAQRKLVESEKKREEAYKLLNKADADYTESCLAVKAADNIGKLYGE